MGGILFKIFIYYLLYKVVMGSLEWLYTRGLPGLIEFIVELVADLTSPPHPNQIAERAREKTNQQAAIALATANLKAAQQRTMAEQAANNRRVRES